jgi:hypothetical protein
MKLKKALLNIPNSIREYDGLNCTKDEFGSTW